MRTFYINAFKDETLTDTDMVGLFDASNFEGKGNCAGWYAVEYYTDTNLLAYYTFDFSSLVDYKKKAGPVKLTRKHYDRIMIDSIYREKRIEAETIEEALKKFMNYDF